MNYFKKGREDKKEEEDKKKPDEEEEEEEENKKEEEGKEKEEEDKGDQGDGRRDPPPLITAPVKKRPIMTRERWMEMAQIRRWEIHITDITIENLYTDSYDPFLEFVIGGDFKIIQKAVKGGKIENQYKGTLGYTVKTEVLPNLESKEKRDFQARVWHEYHGSYFDIQEQYMRIDVWDLEGWNLNTFLGRVEVPLINFASGDVFQELDIWKSGVKKKQKLCKLTFNIAFQEIWDFWLTFSDWSASNILGDKGGDSVSPSIELSLVTQGFWRKKVKSIVIDKEANPMWPLIKGGIHYRGTVNELCNQQLEINLYDGGLLNRKLLGRKTVDLFGVTDFGGISADILQKYKKRGPHICSVKGRINIIKTPRHQQSGEIIMLNSNSQYLCVKVLRVDNIVLPTDRGVINTFMDVLWGGYTKKTKTEYKSYKPIFNDLFYFPIVISQKDSLLGGNKENDRLKAILEELKQSPIISFNFWAIDEKLSNDSLGSTNFFLNELNNGKVQEKEFYDEFIQGINVFKVRVWSGKKQLQSPFIAAGEISNVYIEVYILFENEKKLDYEDLPREKADKLPPHYEENKEKWIENSNNMKESFPDETQREYNCEESDEHGKKHFLPLFVAKTSYPAPPPKVKGSFEISNINYLRVETLKEIAHYVSLVPFAQTGADIWSSPDFLIYMGKGQPVDHAILLANLFMAVRKEEKEEGDESSSDEDEDETTLESKPKKKKEKKSKNEVVDLTDSMERRTFICVGSLKQRKTRHVWVMTVDKDYKGIKFWESTNAKCFELNNRVSSPEDLKKFLNKEEVDKTVLKPNAKEEDKTEQVLNEEIEEEEYEQSEDSEQAEELMEKEQERLNKILGDNRITEKDLGQRETRFKHKRVGFKDEDLEDKKFETKAPAKSYIDAKREIEKNDESNFTSIVQEPRLLPGAQDVNVPYRTIEIIFNNKNAWMNLQHFDPSRIIYDLYDKTLWHPFMPRGGNFTPYYSAPIFAPPLLRGPANKLQSKLLKEVNIGISALRSGKNLGTAWKSQKDPVVELMELHLVFLERCARGEFTEEEIKAKKRDWSIQIRQFMPKHYRVSAIPAHFNYPEPDRITTVFLDEAGDFFKMDHKNLKWALAVKIFPYIGKVISVRLFVAAFYPIPITESSTKD